MILKRLQVNTGLSDPTNCYIIQDEETKETMVIDPGGEPDIIIEMLDILKTKYWKLRNKILIFFVNFLYISYKKWI